MLVDKLADPNFQEILPLQAVELPIGNGCNTRADCSEGVQHAIDVLHVGVARAEDMTDFQF
jgi:hypothetical protein